MDRTGLVRHLGKLGQAFARLMRPSSGSSGSSAPSTRAVVTLADMYELTGEAHHEVSMHEMGDYQSYKERQERLPESSSKPLLELEEAPVRLHAFGNPFKVAKVSVHMRASIRTHSIFELENSSTVLVLNLQNKALPLLYCRA